MFESDVLPGLGDTQEAPTCSEEKDCERVKGM